MLGLSWEGLCPRGGRLRSGRGGGCVARVKCWVDWLRLLDTGPWVDWLWDPRPWGSLPSRVKLSSNGGSWLVLRRVFQGLPWLGRLRVSWVRLAVVVGLGGIVRMMARVLFVRVILVRFIRSRTRISRTGEVRPH